jgi:hypothetical protein
MLSNDINSPEALLDYLEVCLSDHRQYIRRENDLASILAQVVHAMLPDELNDEFHRAGRWMLSGESSCSHGDVHILCNEETFPDVTRTKHGGSSKEEYLLTTKSVCGGSRADLKEEDGEDGKREDMFFFLVGRFG